MSTKYPGGIITKSPATPTGPFETGTAPGIWTITQQAGYAKQGVWPTAGLTANYIEDVFSTYLYTGTGANLTITNNIDLSTNGGLVWIKNRSAVANHRLFDTVRGATKYLASSQTSASATDTTSLTAFNSTGFSLGNNDAGDDTVNGSTYKYASWTFREQAKFFDVLTYTGNGSSITVPHSLGSAPGCIIVKRTDTTSDWPVYHRSVPSNCGFLNYTNAFSSAQRFSSVTSTNFTINVSTADVNASGGTYVAYLFAHDAGGFGLTGTDNVISCGSFTTDGSGNATVNLGYEPQWVLIKDSSTGGTNWSILDTMRGWVADGGANLLDPNTSAAEASYPSPTYTYWQLNSTGFKAAFTSANASKTYIYIAIRRGPMKVPTTGTSVFSTSISSADTGVITSNFVTDMVMTLDRTASGVTPFDRATVDRLRGNFRNLSTATTAAEVNNTSTVSFQQNNGIYLNGGGVYANGYVYQQFKRAPSFFDEVCYTGTGTATAFTHNLAAVPELIITKQRSPSTNNWFTYHSAISATGWVALNLTNATTTSSTVWNDTAPTLSVFTVGTASNNSSGASLVAYLFATCAGVSKVGSYTGNGTTQTINCGFTGGARFVLIKRTDSTGDWYVYDTARGMTTLTDPYLLLNSTAAEVATLGSVTTVSTGFALNSAILAAINVSAGTYIFLAVS